MKPNIYYSLGVIAAAIAMIALVPLAYIWAWNQLFGAFLVIDYTFWNWLAVCVLGTVFQKVNANVRKAR